DGELLAHCRAVAETIPVCGFYLQSSVGGRLLSYEFWREFCKIPAVVAIKVAPFHRYQTLDVVRAVADSGRAEEIAVYTGKDDNGALFDVRNRFAGCIAGLHEILRRQGLMEGRWCLDAAEDLSPGQLEEIDRVCHSYPELTDDEFVRENLDRWLR